MKVAIHCRTPLLGRWVARVVRCGGAEPVLVENIDMVATLVTEGSAQVACLAADVVEGVLPLLRKHRARAFVLVSDTSLHRLLAAIGRGDEVNDLFGLRYPEAPPRAWELLSATRRLVARHAPPSLECLHWGGDSFDRIPATERDRDDIVAEVGAFANLHGSDRIAAIAAEAAHELLMNAMFDAPVDDSGCPLYAHDRTASLQLAEAHRPHFFCGCDGIRLVLSVVDPFGRLTREHVFGGLRRSLPNGEVDRSGGGAGLGFMVLYRACTVLVCDVVPGSRTRVTTVLELDVPQRELRKLPRSIHFFSEGP